MKTQLILLAVSLLPIGITFAQVSTAQRSRSASTAHEHVEKTTDTIPCVARPTRPAVLRVYSQPRHEAFTVQLATGAPRAGLQLELVNVLGSMVLQRELPTAAQFTVPATGVPVGLYWVRLRGPQGYQAAQRGHVRRALLPQ